MTCEELKGVSFGFFLSMSAKENHCERKIEADPFKSAQVTALFLLGW